MMMSSPAIPPASSSGISGSWAEVGIAARIGHQPRARHRGPRQLRQAIDRLLLQRRRPMGMAIPGRIAVEIGEAEIGGKIDDLQRAGQARDHLLGRPMRQAAEDEIDLRPIGLLDLDEARQIEPAEMGKDLRQRLARLAIGGEQADLHPGMKGQKTQQLGAGITAGPENADPELVRRRHVALLPLLVRRSGGPNPEFAAARADCAASSRPGPAPG